MYQLIANYNAIIDSGFQENATSQDNDRHIYIIKEHKTRNMGILYLYKGHTYISHVQTLLKIH